jgi:hypothetical protein
VSAAARAGSGPEALSGGEYRASLVSRLCGAAWPAACTIALLGVFRDLALAPDELREVLAKALRCVPPHGRACAR